MILQIATALGVGIYVVLSKDVQPRVTPHVSLPRPPLPESLPRTGHSPGIAGHSPNIG